jgi:hypothetical protein
MHLGVGVGGIVAGTGGKGRDREERGSLTWFYMHLGAGVDGVVVVAHQSLQ